METETIKCIICEREFPRRFKKRSGQKRTGAILAGERSRNSITCSHNCARAYARIFNRVVVSRDKEIRRLREVIKEVTNGKK